MRTIHYRGEITQEMLSEIGHLNPENILCIDEFESSKQLRDFAKDLDKNWRGNSHVNYITRQDHDFMWYLVKHNGHKKVQPKH